MTPRNDSKTVVTVARLLAAVLIVTVLYFGRDILMPLAVGVLLSFLLSPIVNWIQRLGIPNIGAVVGTAGVTFVLLALGLLVLGSEVSRLVLQLPEYQDELVSKARILGGMTSGMGGNLNNLADEVTEAIEEGENGTPQTTNEPANIAAAAQPEAGPPESWTDRLFPPADQDDDDAAAPPDGLSPDTPLYVQNVEGKLPLTAWIQTVTTVLGPLGTVGLVTVFALFLLIHRENLRDRIIAVVSHGNYVATTEALNEVARRISRYILAQTVINTSYGFVLGVGLMGIGWGLTDDGYFPNAPLWGAMATCLRYVPYIGPIAGATLPLALSVAVFPGYTVFFAVLALIVVLELISNNIIEPWLYGASTGISAVAVITAAVFWGWLWGPVGLLLSTPLTVCLVVLGRHVPSFRIVTTLLGEDVHIKPSIRFYQRLLAEDRHRAKEMLSGYVTERKVEAACDQLLVPALKRVRSDFDAEELSEEGFASLCGAIDELIQEINWMGEEVASNLQTEEEIEQHDLPLVVGCPAHHATEMILLKMLQYLSVGRWRLELLDQEMLPSDVGQWLATHNPAAAVIMVLPKGGFAQARYLCRSIRKQGYRGPIVVACMGRFKHYDRLFVRFRRAGANSMTTTFKQTRLKLESLVDLYLQAEEEDQPRPEPTEPPLPPPVEPRHSHR